MWQAILTAFGPFPVPIAKPEKPPEAFILPKLKDGEWGTSIDKHRYKIIFENEDENFVDIRIVEIEKPPVS